MRPPRVEIAKKRPVYLTENAPSRALFLRRIFHIGAFFRLYSDWLQTGFRLSQLTSDCVFIFQIPSCSFRVLFRLVWENRKNFMFCLHFSYCFRLGGASTKEDNAVAFVVNEEEEEIQRPGMVYGG